MARREYMWCLALVIVFIIGLLGLTTHHVGHLGALPHDANCAPMGMGYPC